VDLPATADVVVVGAGIAGASAAWAIAERGASVVVLEAEATAGHHATGRSAALLTETYGSAPVLGLVRASRPFIESPPEGFADHPLTTPRGVLWIARPESADRLRADAAEWAAPHEVLDLAGARAHVPLLRDEACAGAVYEPGAVDIDVDALHQGYLRSVRRAGGTVALGTPVSAIARQGSQGWTVTTTAGEVVCGTIVDAAGAWGDVVAAMAGVEPLGLRPLRRTAFLFDQPDEGARGWPLVVDVDDRFYVKPDAGKLLGSLADETPSEPCDAKPEELDVALAIDRIEEALDLRVKGVARPWAGLRTFSPDRVPTVGADPDHPGFVWVVGQGGYGIKTSPAMSWAAAAATLDEPWPEQLTAAGIDAGTLSPSRFR
jgi:D-arginine dehydrogenase